MKNCPKCELIQNMHLLGDQLVQEFEYGVWILSPNQFYRGYSELVLKPHVREWHDLGDDIAHSLNDNLRTIASTVTLKLKPIKINLACYGNVVEHLHWHIVPRYLEDPHHRAAPDLTLPASLTPELACSLKKSFVD